MNAGEMSPVTLGRLAVRGLSASNLRSTSRLTVIANVRAATMQVRISANRSHPGHIRPIARDAMKAAINANGNAKIECAN